MADPLRQISAGQKKLQFAQKTFHAPVKCPRQFDDLLTKVSIKMRCIQNELFFLQRDARSASAVLLS